MIYSEYYISTGEFTGRSIGTDNPLALLENTEDGCSLIQGQYYSKFAYVDVSVNPHVAIDLDQTLKDNYDVYPGRGYAWDRATGVWVDNRTLDLYKKDRILLIKKEAIIEINVIFPALQSVDDIKLFREFYLSIAPAARQPTVNFTKVIDTYQTAQTGITAVNAATTKAGVDAVTVIWPL